MSTSHSLNKKMLVPEQPFSSELHYYYAIARSLHRGRNPSPAERSTHKNLTRRPPLPLELVLLIFRYAKIRNKHPSRDLSFTWKCRNEAPTEVIATSWRVKRLQLFSSPPMTASVLSRIAAICLITKSKDQGRWCPSWDRESYSWFELGAERAGDQVLLGAKCCKLEPTPSETHEYQVDECQEPYLRESQEAEGPLRWKSHSNRIASKSFQRHVGQEFTADNKLLMSLEEGDRLAVWLCAQHPGWSCEVQSASICVWEWFEPKFV